MDPIAVLNLGLKVTGYGIKEDAIRWIVAAWKEEQIGQLFMVTSNSNIREQCEVLDIMAKFATLDQVPHPPHPTPRN